MSQTNKMVLAMLAAAALAGAFWMLALSPKREEAADLAKQTKQLQESLAQHRAEVAHALQARREFPVDYQQLVVMGKAVPGDDDTPSLLVQLNRIANRSHVDFHSISLSGGGSGGGEEATAAPPPAEGATPASPTEVAASLLPLGASIGPAGLAVMPYTVSFSGSFFHLAEFIEELDSLVETENDKALLTVNGRLITIGGFSLAVDPERGFPSLESTFTITTFLTPPSQGITAGATPESPAAATATPASTTTGGTP